MLVRALNAFPHKQYPHTPNTAKVPFPTFFLNSILPILVHHYLRHISSCSFCKHFISASERIFCALNWLETKGSFNVMEGGERKGRVAVGTCDLLLRLLALGLTLVAAVVLGADKQTTVVPIKLVDSLPPLDVPVTAKWHYLSAFVYFVVANAIACAYAALSLLLALTNRGKSKGLGTLVTVLDALMVALLFSCNGAAIAVGVLGFQGNSHVRWNKVCNIFGKFCHQAAASLIISLIGSIAFLLLVVVPALRLHRRA